MPREYGKPKGLKIDKELSGDGSSSPNLQAEQSEDAHRSAVRYNDENAIDEIDRQIETAGKWLATKCKEAKLIDIAQILIGFGALILGVIAAYIYGGQLSEMKRTNDLNNRPWVSNGREMVIEKQFGFTTMDEGRNARITLDYDLVNSGGSPAYVFINAKIVEYDPAMDNNREADQQCMQAAQTDRRPITVIAKSHSLYGIHYDGVGHTNTTESMAFVAFSRDNFDPNNTKSHFLVNIGCIVYQSTVDDPTGPHRTPFIGYLNINNPDPSVPVITGPWGIGDAH